MGTSESLLVKDYFCTSHSFHSP